MALRWMALMLWVMLLPWVSRVIEVETFDALSVEFLREHHIDTVAHGDEYDPTTNLDFARRVAEGECPDYYKVVRESGGRFEDVPLPRTPGVSTSSVFSRVIHRVESDPSFGRSRNDGGPADKKQV